MSQTNDFEFKFYYSIFTESVPDYSKMSLTQAKRYEMDSQVNDYL